jgi:hypothetical protein
MYEPVSKRWLWISYLVSAIPVILLLFSAVLKFVKPTGFDEGMAQMGWPMSLANTLGIIELGCTIIYLIPRTAVLGAVLLTGYLGGATATHLRINDVTFFMPVIVGMVVWLGLYLREPRLRALLPLRK